MISISFTLEDFCVCFQAFKIDKLPVPNDIAWLYLKTIFLYSHWMSNFQPSSSASEGDMWLYALHDKYFPASERLKVIDNVLVVWLPSLDVCNKNNLKPL